MEMLTSLNSRLRKMVLFVKQYRMQKTKYRYHLVDVNSRDNKESFELTVVIQGIKLQMVHFLPEMILYDDALLSEFSPCDVRAISYLSFRKYFNADMSSLVITHQYCRNGETVFTIQERFSKKTESMSAKTLYQNHDLLTRLSRKDMINVISTAVQEQTIKDFERMR